MAHLAERLFLICEAPGSNTAIWKIYSLLTVLPMQKNKYTGDPLEYFLKWTRIELNPAVFSLAQSLAKTFYVGLTMM